MNKTFLSALCLLSSVSLPLPAQDLTESYRNALVSYKSGQYADAAVPVEKAITEGPKDARPLLLRGRIETALKRFDAAEKDLHAALQLDHNSNLGYFYLGELFYVQRKYDLARVQYTTYHHLVPTDPDAVLKLVYCAIGSNDLGEAQHLTNTLNLFDEKNPAGYFAQAAMAHTTEPATAPDSDKPKSEKLLQQAELLYGDLMYSHYLADYLALFTPPSPPPAAK
jgi:tetratricopeptide (TPR) repeat protein